MTDDDKEWKIIKTQKFIRDLTQNTGIFRSLPFMNTLFRSSGILVPWKKTQCVLLLSLVVFLQSRGAFLSSGTMLVGNVIVCMSFIL